LGAIGGSHAQRDLFEQVYVDALRQVEQHEVHYFSFKQHSPEPSGTTNQKPTAIYGYQNLAAKAC
ncbi:MAG TPA: hypothetical protein V6D16_10135, partial [Candidatus Obscuribacterales bacterium]